MHAVGTVAGSLSLDTCQVWVETPSKALVVYIRNKLIAQYWLVPGTDSSIIYKSTIAGFTLHSLLSTGWFQERIQA